MDLIMTSATKKTYNTWTLCHPPFSLPVNSLI